MKIVARDGFDALALVRAREHKSDDARLVRLSDVCSECLPALADMLRREAQFRYDLATLLTELKPPPKKGNVLQQMQVESDGAAAALADVPRDLDRDDAFWVSGPLLALWEKAARAAVQRASPSRRQAAARRNNTASVSGSAARTRNAAAERPVRSRRSL